VNAPASEKVPPQATAEERALRFGCEGETLFGVLHLAEQAADVGVVVIVGGPQYRAGSHRQFVLLARTLASHGFAVLRFDCRGMGDATGGLRDFTGMTADIRAAIDTLHLRVPRVRRVVLWGLCDAASAALLYLDETQDGRVAGVCLANPWVRSEESLAKTQIKHYYARRLFERAFWIKLARGGVGMAAVRELTLKLWHAGSRRRSRPGDAVAPSFQKRMARGWQRLQGPSLMLLSGEDYTAKEFQEHAAADAEWRAALQSSRVQTVLLPQADHTFSSIADREHAELETVRWLKALTPCEAP
jgi:uncharacterized protein